MGNKKLNANWYVIYNDINARKIVPFNIFKHSSFAKDVERLLKSDVSRKDFSEMLRRILGCYFWGKCEYEQTICSCPVYIDGEELARANDEYEDYNTKYGHYPYKINIEPDISEKYSIYDQVMLNFEMFCDYVWAHKIQVTGGKMII